MSRSGSSENPLGSPLLQVHGDQQEDMLSVRGLPRTVEEELLRFMVLEFKDDKVKLRPYEETLEVLSSIHPTTSLTLARSSSFRTRSTYRMQHSQDHHSILCSPSLAPQNDEQPITPSSHETNKNQGQQQSGRTSAYESEILDQTMLEEIEPQVEKGEEETESKQDVDFCVVDREPISVKALEDSIENEAENNTPTPRFPLMNRKNLATFSPEELNYRWRCEVCGIAGLRSCQYWSHCLEDEHRRRAEAAGISVDAECLPASSEEQDDAVDLDAENSAGMVATSLQPIEVNVYRYPVANEQVDSPLADLKTTNATRKDSPMEEEITCETESAVESPTENSPVEEAVGARTSSVEPAEVTSTTSVDDFKIDSPMDMNTTKDLADANMTVDALGEISLKESGGIHGCTSVDLELPMSTTVDDFMVEFSMEMETTKDLADENLADPLVELDSVGREESLEWNPPPTNDNRIWTSSIRSLLLCPRTPTERRRRFSADVWENLLESVEREQSPKKSHQRRRSCPDIFSPVGVENLNGSITFSLESPSFNLGLGGELEVEETDQDVSGELNGSGGFGLLARLAFFA